MSAPSFSLVHTFVPARVPSGRLPTILALHGTGGDERDLLPLLQPMLPGAAILAPRGNVLEHGMPRFFRRLAVGVLDAEDLTRRAHDLADFVEAAAAHYGFDPKRIVAFGYSNGANIASAVMLLRPTTLAGGLLLRPMMVPVSPDPLPDLSSARIGILAGEQDELTPQESTIQLAQLFARCGAQVDLSWSRGGHGLMPDDFAASVEWLKTWAK